MIEVLNKDPEKIETRYFCGLPTFYPQTSKEAILCNMRKQFDIEISSWPESGQLGNDYTIFKLTGKDENIDAAVIWAMSMGVRIEMVRQG